MDKKNYSFKVLSYLYTIIFTRKKKGKKKSGKKEGKGKTKYRSGAIKCYGNQRMECGFCLSTENQGTHTTKEHLFVFFAGLK